MKHLNVCRFVAVGMVGLFLTVSLAQAQLHLVAQNAAMGDTTISPEDPSVFPAAPIVSPEIFALDVPAIPSANYVQFTSSTIWQVWLTSETPVRATFMLRFELTSPALPSGVNLRYAVPLTWFRNNLGTAGGFQGGNGVDSEVITRKDLADLLISGNPGLTEPIAGAIIDDLFARGFHVSVHTQLRSQNVTDAVVTNPNVAFFAESGRGQ